MQNTVSRREFGKSVVAATVSGSVVGSMTLASGCNASQWISTVLQDLPTILSIITTILQVIGAAGVSVAANVIAAVNEYGGLAVAALKEAQVLVGQYNAAVSSDRPGLLGKIHTALTTAQTNLNNILNVFSVTDPTLQAAISAGIGSAITVILGIETLIPPPPAPTPVQVKLARHDERDAMRESFNAIVAKRYPKYTL